MNWISVKDRLPKDEDSMCPFDWVLVFGERDNMYLKAIAQWDGNKWNIFEDCGAHCDTGFYFMESSDVTHWAHITNP